MKTIIRGRPPGQSFTQISNAALRNRALSLKARGLLAAMLSYPPEHFFTLDSLARITPDGRDSIRSAIKELRSAGHVAYKSIPSGNGHPIKRMFVYETPAAVGTLPDTGNSFYPNSDFPKLGNPALKDKYGKEEANTESVPWAAAQPPAPDRPPQPGSF